jgi:competence protein ComEA
MSFKNFLREYFTFNRRQRNGVFILLSVILILILYLSFADSFSSSEKIDFSKFEKDITQFEAAQTQKKDSASSEIKDHFTSSNSPEPESAERFPFDPNNLSDEDWSRLGLSDKQIKAIRNYESKGGKFRNKEDVKKMYVISPEVYASLQEYIRIPEDTSGKREVYKKFEKEKLMVELNSADTVQLDKLKGIGFAFAKRIIKYRELLGGFIKKEQLLEVYALDKEKYDLLSDNVFVDDLKLKKININTADLKTLQQHPYVKYNLANLIVNYRDQHGYYKSVEDIKKLNLMNDEIYNKLVPYLTIE